MLAGRRFQVELTDVQERLAQQTADVCRAVWNIGLEQRREYRRRGAWMNYGPQAGELVEAKPRSTDELLGRVSVDIRSVMLRPPVSAGRRWSREPSPRSLLQIA
jgi:hypothetical protein